MADLIDRQTAIETAIEAADKWDGGYSSEREGIIRKFFDKIPAAQPDHTADIGKKVSISCGRENDLISRQAALKKLAVYIHLIDKTMGKGLLTDDACMEAAKSVLGEDEIPAVQPATNCSEIPNSSDDTISRQAAIDALARMMPRSYTPDGSHPADEEIFRAQEVFADCIEALEILPSAQPEIIRCKDCKYRYLDGMIWNCPFGLSGGEDFFCAYGAFCPECGADMRGGDSNEQA